MESERKYDEVITRFLLDEAAPEEEKFVLDWMAADEKNRLYIESLRNTLHLVDVSRQTSKIEVEKEWEQFCKVVFDQQPKVLHLNPYALPDGESSFREEPAPRARLYKLLIAAAVAASILLIVGFGAGWFSTGSKPETAVAKKENALKEAKIDPLMAIVQHEVNTSGKARELILPDGSKITLSDSSELTYKEPVDGKRRDVYLVGKADFRVAKNKVKPFTVFSEEISTTALGTMFSVTAKKSDRMIRIKLFEGKVVVRSLKGYNKNWTGELYLRPGQELAYDRKQKTATVTSFAVETKSHVKVVNQVKENPSIPHFDKRSWFMFNNQALSEIFDALAEMYDAKILYSKKDVKDMYFIGTYDKSDSLDKILKQIALLNDLKVTQQNGTYKIEKNKLQK
jgi:transmembrane sensor